jgi:hypothetical protein
MHLSRVPRLAAAGALALALLPAASVNSPAAARPAQQGAKSCADECMGNDTPTERANCLKQCPAQKSGGTSKKKKAITRMRPDGASPRKPRYTARPDAGRTMRR